jgi:hypothetical protein
MAPVVTGDDLIADKYLFCSLFAFIPFIETRASK